MEKRLDFDIRVAAIAKEKRKALVICLRQYPIITEIADIDMCPMFGKYSAVELKETKIPWSHSFPLKGFRSGVKLGMIPIPFSENYVKLEIKELSF